MNIAPEKGLKDYPSKMLIGARADAEVCAPYPGRVNDILLRDFNVVTLTAYFKRTWLGPFSYDFRVFNQWVNWAKAHDLPIVMHMLAGHKLYYPEWARNAAWEGPDQAFLAYQYIRQLMTENDNGKKIDVFNVVNEFLDPVTGAYRPESSEIGNFLLPMGWEKDESGLSGEARVNALHPRALTFLFETAARFTDAKLELREDCCDFEPDGRKVQAMRQQILHLRNKGCRVDAVGLQCHLFWEDRVDYSRLDLFQRNVEQFHEMGLEVYVTELDIPLLPDGEAAQARRWADFVRACRACGVEQLHVWGLADGVDKNWRVGTHPLLFDEQYREKAAYYAVAEALSE